MDHTDLSSDMNLLPDDAAAHPAYPAFVTSMLGRAYGRPALRDAWAWFTTGWEARGGDPGLRAPSRGEEEDAAMRAAWHREWERCQDARHPIADLILKSGTRP